MNFWRPRKLLPQGTLWMLLLLTGCSSLSEALLPQSKEEPGPGTRAQRQFNANMNQFQWGIQYFEAGDYSKALEVFQQLEKQGPTFEGSHRLSYYQGLSHYYLGQMDRAEAELQNFLSKTPLGREPQEARIVLLQIYEEKNAWGQLLSLAAETEKGPLFQLQRANLKLLWGMALVETGERKAAAELFKEAQSVLEPTSQEANATQEREPNRDLWGRYYFSQLRLRQGNCSFPPKRIGTGKNAKKLLSPWLEARADCLIQFVSEGTQNLWQREGFWPGRSFQILDQMIDLWGEEGRAETKALGANIRLQQSIRTEWQQASYRVISRLSSSIKILENRGLSAEPLKAARKRLDLLIVKNSSPSS
jgi:tetratricopeptide (TPR) repeat protein